jgi:phage shock protein C
MFCSHCGNQMEADAKFCPSCGAVAQPTVVVGRAPFAGQLTRPRYPRMIAGVCSGLALHYGWDLSLVRVLAVVTLFLSGGTAMLAYFIAWIIIPEAPYVLPDPGTGSSTGTAV